MSVLLLWFSAAMSLPLAAAQPGGIKVGLQKVKTDVRGKIGNRRTYRYYLPTDYDASIRYPLVVALHGGVSSSRNIRLRSGLDALAEREGFIVLYPEGDGIAPFLKHWNAGTCCGKALKEGIDDAGYVLARIDDVTERFSIDIGRVYMLGFSNGGMLTYQIAATHPERIAAFAAISATFGTVRENGDYNWFIPNPALPLAALIIHGDADPRLPFPGIVPPDTRRDGFGMIPVMDSARHWAEMNHCTAPESSADSGFDNVDLYEWNQCDNDVQVRLYRLHGWKHAWAGKSRETRADHRLVGGFETAEVMWDFFKQFRSSGVQN